MKRSRPLLTVAALVAATLSRAQAGEPTAQDLIALAPILDSADGSCRSLDIVGRMGDDKDPGPRLNFRAIYRAPDHFSLLISAATDGTPVTYCSGRKIFVYDPVGPAVYYSEAAGFDLLMKDENGSLKFNYNFLLWRRDRSRVLLDFRSVMTGFSEALRTRSEPPRDQVHKIGEKQYSFDRYFEGAPEMQFRVDLGVECPYTTAALVRDGLDVVRFDRLTLNGPIEDELFAFPEKERLGRGLPLKVAPATQDLREALEISEVATRALFVRGVIYRPGSPGPLKIPGLSSKADWKRVVESDRKYAKTLKDLIPPGLQVR